jgi:hypothetical protein
MSAYILGREITASLGLLDFEFARECVSKGLQPHDGQGQPYRPADVVQQFIAVLEHELAQHEDTASNLSWGDRDEIIANHVGPLQRRIQGYRLYLESLNGTGWNGFEFPQDKDLSAHFIKILMNSLYQKAGVEKFHSAPAEPAVAAPIQSPVKPRKLRPEQRHRLACIAVAERLCKENPNMRSHEMVLKDEIANACEGKVYGEKTIKRWVKDICQNRRPGIPKKKSS